MLSPAPADARSRLATRLSFLVAGFGLACWAPLVPFAKARLAVDDGALGLLLLCIGLGSVTAMQFAGVLTSRYGSRLVILLGGIGMAATLPLLSIATTVVTMGATLLAFGAFLGVIEVAMNIHAVEVERRAGLPLMSGFHALFSIGGFAGAGLMTAALSATAPALAGTLVASMLMIVALVVAAPSFIATPKEDDTPLFVIPRGIVALLSLLAAITFLVEGAILDWSALLLTDAGLVTAAKGGIGYMIFAIAMTIGRLAGDAIVARLGDCRTMLLGGLVAVAGFGILLLAPVAAVALLGFLLIGLGASNIVPVLFRQAGAQFVMPASLAVAAVSTIGYAGILAGPAGIGFVAHAVGLPIAFTLLAALLCLVPACARRATAGKTAVGNRRGRGGAAAS